MTAEDAQEVIAALDVVTTPLAARVAELERKAPGGPSTSELREQLHDLARRLDDLEAAATAPTKVDG